MRLLHVRGARWVGRYAFGKDKAARMQLVPTLFEGSTHQPYSAWRLNQRFGKAYWEAWRADKEQR